MFVGTEIHTNIDSSVNLIFKRMINTLVDRNCELTGLHNIKGFIHNGVIYTHSEYKQAGKIKKLEKLPWPSLVRDLQHEGDALEKLVMTATSEARKAKQILSLMYKNAKTHQDVRNALPDNVLHLAPSGIQNRERTEKLENSISAHALRVYEAGIDSVDYIATLKLLYG